MERVVGILIQVEHKAITRVNYKEREKERLLSGRNGRRERRLGGRGWGRWFVWRQW
jgi:hypothetical protein